MADHPSNTMEGAFPIRQGVRDVAGISFRYPGRYSSVTPKAHIVFTLAPLERPRRMWIVLEACLIMHA